MGTAVVEVNEQPARVESPLEVFLRDYVETAGGAWDEVEPEVYDVLPPPGLVLPGGAEVIRLAFDPEALPDFPNAQLASYGTPFIDRLLRDAVERGRSAHFYVVGQNLQPHDMLARLRRALTLAPPASLQVDRVRLLHFPQALFWFQVSLVAEQKEQVILPVAIDLHSGREVRHRDELLDPGRLSHRPAQPLPPAQALSLAEGHQQARAQVLRGAVTLANNRGRELSQRLEQQVQRLQVYYADLRAELAEQRQRARKAEEADARHAERLAALQREEELRIAEIRQKSVLQAELRLLQLLRLDQPKLQVRTRLEAPGHVAGTLEVVWDPLVEVVEAPNCPNCHRPSYSFMLDKYGRVGCEVCGPALAQTRPRR